MGASYHGTLWSLIRTEQRDPATQTWFRPGFPDSAGKGEGREELVQDINVTDFMEHLGYGDTGQHVGEIWDQIQHFTDINDDLQSFPLELFDYFFKISIFCSLFKISKNVHIYYLIFLHYLLQSKTISILTHSSLYCNNIHLLGKRKYREKIITE